MFTTKFYDARSLQARSIARLVVSIILLSPAISAAQQLVINEVMINEPGSYISLEWIELFNRGPDDGNLANYKLVEGEDTTSFESLVVPSGGYVILARKLNDDSGKPSFESWWGDSSGVWGDAAMEDFPVVETKMSLRNSNDSIMLLDLEHGLTEQVSWSLSPPDGVSWERKNPYIDRSENNFGESVAEDGSTPGRGNSILAPANDLGIVLDSVQTELTNESTGEINLYATISNHGLTAAEGSVLELILDRDHNHKLTEVDSLWHASIPALNPGENYPLISSLHPSGGRISILAHLPDDDFPDNNAFDTTFALGSIIPEFVINELQLSAESSNGREWVELRNVAGFPLNLGGFRIGVPGREAEIVDSVEIDSSELALICQDTTVLRSAAPEINCPLVELSPWIGLDDGGGALRLVSDLGILSDSVEFSATPQAGVSWERDTDTSGGSFAELFYPSSNPFGSTPGVANSQRVFPPTVDLALDTDSLLRRYENEEMDELTLGLMVSNLGLDNVSNAVVSIYDNRHLDTPPQTEELIKRIPLDFLPAGASQLLQAKFKLDAGFHRLIWQLPHDDIDSNNTAVLECSFGPITNEIIVTEYLANPAEASACEWVELQNISDRPISLTGWQFGDAVRLHEIEDEITLKPRDYLILAEDVDCLDYFSPDICIPQALSGWSSLNNDGDRVILRDQYSVVVDSFTYTLTAAANRSIELNQKAFAAGERIWYPSTAELGATPCSQNSVTGTEDVPIKVLLPRPVFCPSAGEQLEIRITCPPATKLSLEVYDLAGRRVSVLADQRLFSSTSLYYAGESESNSKLRAGAYILLVTGGDDSDFTEKFGFAVAPLH